MNTFDPSSSDSAEAPLADPARAAKFGLPFCLQTFRERVEQAGESHPEMPTDLVFLSRLFGHVFLRMEAAFDTLMARWALSAASWLALMVLYSRIGEDVTPSDLSRVLFLARANVTRVTDDLVRRGFVHRAPSTSDRRVLNLSLTEAGHAQVTEIMPHAWDLHRAIWSGVPAARLAAAEDLLRTLLQGIESWNPLPPQTFAPVESE